MKGITLPQGKVAIVDDEDFDLLSQWKWSLSNGYATRRLKRLKLPNGKTKQRDQKMHRLLLGEPSSQIDHINRNKLDNRKENLRLATGQQNRCNRPKTKANTSGYKGVTFAKDKNLWQAQIRSEGRYIHLGRYFDPRTAALKYDQAAEKYFGEFAYLNFPARHQ